MDEVYLVKHKKGNIISIEEFDKIENTKEVGESWLKSGKDHHLMICLSKEDLMRRESELSELTKSKGMGIDYF